MSSSFTNDNPGNLHDIINEWNDHRKKLNCCSDMVSATFTGLIDWFNEYYDIEYYSFPIPKKGVLYFL
jgi:hypothetical protein